VEEKIQAKVFPIPATEKFSVQFTSPKDNFTRFALYDATGKEVRLLLEDNLKAGTSIFSFSTQYLSNGIYFLSITNKGNLLRTEKIIISR
jgi:hypothetical protein